MSRYTINTPTVYTLPSAGEAQAFVKGVNVGSKNKDKPIVVYPWGQEEVEVIVYATSQA
jgi:hypothetical protein